MTIGTLCGVIVFILVKGALGLLLFDQQELDSWLALLGALWAAWPFYERTWSARRLFLHPPIRKYKVPIKQAFAIVRQVLTNSTYNYGDKWTVTQSDTQKKRITAVLRFSDEEDHLHGRSVLHAHVRRERKHRLVELEVQMKEAAEDSTQVQFDFRARAEGVGWQACDRVIYAFLGEVHKLLGHGEEVVTSANDSASSAPPWWLISLAAAGLISFAIGVAAHFFALQDARERAQAKSAFQEQQNRRLEKDQAREIASWKEFKLRYIER